MSSAPFRFDVRRLLAGCALGCLSLACCLKAAPGPTLADQVRQRELAGDLNGARGLLEQESGNAAGAEQAARFLDRHNDPGRRDAYLKWASVESDAARKRGALRQAVLIDVLEGRHEDLQADLEHYKAAGGTDFAGSGGRRAVHYSTVQIPGPLSSFARMAALSPELGPEELLPSLARNLTTNGFEASGNELLQPTEYLRLLTRYVGQARELQGLANGEHKIVIPACDSEQTGSLLKVLGYRMRGSCGSDLVLETVNPTRAFLTVDSGFPLTALEQDLRAGRRFELKYGATAVPVLYDGNYWMSAAGRPTNGDFLDALMAEPALCRLYLGLSHLDQEVAEALRKQMPPAKLRLYSNILDFYGGMLRIENGAVVVPGPAKTWAGIVGTSPSNAGPFLEKLLTTDDGWLMSYYDALMRMNEGPVYTYLTQPERLKRFYDALRGKITTPGPARPVFRSSTDLMIFTTSLWAEPNGTPHMPGNLEIWRMLFIKHPHGKYDGKLTRSAASWKNKDDLLEALFALSRKTADNEPLHIFLALNDVDRNRAHPLSPELAGKLISSYRAYGAQYGIFADSPVLSEASISAFLDLCGQNVRDQLSRADRAGSLQALVELWVALCRQNAIAPEAQDEVFSKLLRPWVGVGTEAEIFTAARKGVETLAAAIRGNGSNSQERLVTALVGHLRNEEGAPPAPAAVFWRYFDAQQLIPLEAIFAAVDHAGKGDLDPKVAKVFHDRVERLEESNQLHESISRDEKSALASGYWTDRHIENELKFSLDALNKAAEKKDARAVLEPFLRDTLVGILYCYYAPAGSEILLTNPMFVRSHDFAGSEGVPEMWRTTEVTSAGWPNSAGGKLAGSLIRLPYALAQAEQNFLVPRKEQALIWADLVPQLLIDVTIARWQNVTPEQVRWVALHIQRGRNLMAAAALSPAIEDAVVASLSRFMMPANIQLMRDELHGDRPSRALNMLPPSYLYAMGDDPKLRTVSLDATSAEIEALAGAGSPALTPESISRTFGTPKPMLTHCSKPGLLYLRTFPTLMGYSSRLMAESWESNNLFYAALADEAGIRAEDLDAYVPEWNRTAIENIFATHLEDWPALIRSLNLTAESVLRPSKQQAAAITPEN